MKTTKGDETIMTNKKQNILTGVVLGIHLTFYVLQILSYSKKWNGLMYVSSFMLFFLLVFEIFLVLAKKGKPTLFDWIYISINFVATIGLTIYTITIISNNNAREVVAAIASAIIGGIIALFGVGITIKYSAIFREEDEIKKAKPVFSFAILNNIPSGDGVGESCFPEDDELEYRFEFYGMILNSNNSSFTFKRVFHDNKWFELTANTVIIPGAKKLLSFRFNSYEKIFLELEDTLEKKHYYEIKVVFMIGECKPNETPFYYTNRIYREEKDLLTIKNLLK